MLFHPMHFSYCSLRMRSFRIQQNPGKLALKTLPSIMWHIFRLCQLFFHKSLYCGPFFFSWFRNQSKTTQWNWGVGSGIEHLLNMCETPGSISCPTRKIKSHTLHLAVTLQAPSNWEQLLIAPFLWSSENFLKHWDLSSPWGQMEF